MGNYMNVVANNIPGMYSQRQLGIVNTNKSKSAEKLSSGYRINRAADDAAGLTISENMRRMIRGLTQASLNVEDGVSLCQVADGYLDEVHDMLHRLTELSVQGSNGTLTDDDRAAINEEVDALKKEMRRIFNVANFNEIPLFHVPYTPDIEPDPEVNDMELFHVGNGNIGGLEFNNVRYNISELQDKGLKIDSDGIATEDFEASFELYDGETVDISMKKGESLAAAKRNYNWKAKDDGIYINNKLSAEWSEVIGPDGHALGSNTDRFSPGTYQFTHHGMKIYFEIDEESTLEDVFNGINGDAATEPATWDIFVGGYNRVKAADMSGTSEINVTNTNKDYIDHNYYVLANEDGIAIKRQNPSGASEPVITTRVAWDTFSDSSIISKTDNNGNAIETNGGYPINNWGDVNDSNGQSAITFDGDATYHFTSPDSTVKIEFDFKLAESASLDEVTDSLNNTLISATMTAPGVIQSPDVTDVGKIQQYANNLNNNFSLQRAYGRDFDNKNAKLRADITVERTTIAGQPSAADRPGSNGNYEGNTHTVTRSLIPGGRVQEGTSQDMGSSSSYFVVAETYQDYARDGEGNILTDGEGNPIMTDYTRYKCYQETVTSKKDTYNNTYSATDTWIQLVHYTFDGSLNGHDMKDVTKTLLEKYSRDLIQTRKEYETYDSTSVREVTLPDEIKDYIDANGTIPSSITIGGNTYSVSQKADEAAAMSSNGRISNIDNTFDGYVTAESGVGTATMIQNGYNAQEIDFYADESGITGTNKALSFRYMVNLDQSRYLADHSGPQSLGTLTFVATDFAKRYFTPIENSGRISEATYDNVKIKVPKKKLNIQAGADKGNTITMEWNALNLTIIGLSGANTKTQDSAMNMIGRVQNALDIISETRSTFGAYQNRFEHTIRNLDNVVENTQAAESLIRDTDMAKEMVNYSKQNILEQAGTAMLTQSNQSKQWIISLLNQ